MTCKSIAQKRLNYIMDQLNHRPRKTLGFKTPCELFFKKKTLLTAALQTWIYPCLKFQILFINNISNFDINNRLKYLKAQHGYFYLVTTLSLLHGTHGIKSLAYGDIQVFSGPWLKYPPYEIWHTAKPVKIFKVRGNWPFIRKPKKQLWSFFLYKNKLIQKPFFYHDLLVSNGQRLETFDFLFCQRLNDDDRKHLNQYLKQLKTYTYIFLIFSTAFYFHLSTAQTL